MKIKQKTKKKVKKIISILFAVIIVISFCSPFIISKANEGDKIEVYITVSDITDYAQPINVLIPRQKLSVSQFNLADFGDTMTGIECIEGITYLHALTQLHRNLYGDKDVPNKLLLTTDGVTKIFMGKSVANVMYKNGKDIFALPQLVNIKDGDEIQVCLYDEGHSQAIATFNEAKIDDVSPHESIALTLQQHYGFPRDRDAIPYAEIINSDGVYLTDEDGNVVTTNDNGEFLLSFPEEGTYTISAMPVVNYYMSDIGGGIKVEWVPQKVKKEVECITYIKDADTDPEGKALYDAVYGNDRDGAIILFDWNEEKHSEPLITIAPGLETCEKTVIGYEEVTELVKVETVVSDMLEPMVTYTTPFVTIDVTTDLIIENVYKSGNNLVVETKNSEYNSDHDMYIAGYSLNDGAEMLGECKTFANIQKQHRAVFSKAYDLYKIFVWQDGTMIPIMGANSFDPNISTQTLLDYDYTLPMPNNTYVTEKTN